MGAELVSLRTTLPNGSCRCRPSFANQPMCAGAVVTFTSGLVQKDTVFTVANVHEYPVKSGAVKFGR